MSTLRHLETTWPDTVTKTKTKLVFLYTCKMNLKIILQRGWGITFSIDVSLNMYLTHDKIYVMIDKQTY